MGETKRVEWRIYGVTATFPRGFVSKCPEGQQEAEERARTAIEAGSTNVRIEQRTVVESDWEPVEGSEGEQG